MRLAGVLLCVLLTTASIAPAQRKKAPSLAARIQRIIGAAPSAAWGIQVVDLRTGATIYARNERNHFVPASNTKLFSTALALTRLGPDHRFRTIVSAPEKPDRSGKVASLRLVGGGDPNLSGRVLPYQYKAERGNPLQHVERFAQELFDGGLRLVDGDIIADDSAYVNEPFPEGWAVDDPIYDYGAPVSALFLNDGMFTLRVGPRSEGEPPALEFIPPVEGMVFQNQAITRAGPADLSFARLPGSNELRITGAVNSSREYLFAVDDPPLVAAEALRDALLERGVRVTGVARVEHFPAPGIPLVTYQSRPLAEALAVINKDSVNLHAEIVLLETARVRTGEGTRKAGVQQLEEFLKEIGVDTKDYTFEDGSGLSRKTLVTPRAVTRLLSFMYATPHRDSWIATLPIAGEDGTLSNRFQRIARAREIRAKTGSLSHVNGLSGYIGNRYAFSILVNNSNATAASVRRVMDQILVALLR